jgi:hypothetical protein
VEGELGGLAGRGRRRLRELERVLLRGRVVRAHGLDGRRARLEMVVAEVQEEVVAVVVEEEMGLAE